MKEQTFLEKYPEFKEKEEFNAKKSANGESTYYESDIEEILDKHFVRKEDALKKELHGKELVDWILNGDKKWLSEKKVKDAIDKLRKENKRWKNSISEINRESVLDVEGYLVELKKELGLE